MMTNPNYRIDDGYEASYIYAETLADAIAQAKAFASGGDQGDGGFSSEWSVCATVDGKDGETLASGTVDIPSTEPECPGYDDHWLVVDPIDGCRENPGCWSLGGTAMLFRTYCLQCGGQRDENVTGSQRNPGESDTVTWTDASDDTIERLREHYAEEVTA